MSVILTQKITRPNTLNGRKLSFMNWMADRVKSKYYANHNSCTLALDRIN